MPFDQPSSGTWLKPSDHKDHLLLITKVHSVTKHYDDLKKAEVDKAEIDVVDLDDATPTLQTMLNSHPGIVNKLRKLQVGGNPVLGRITQVPTSYASPAWVLSEYRPGDDARAEAWLKANPLSTFAQPAATPAAAPDPWTAPPAATPAAPTPPVQMVTLPDGSQVTPEIAALLGQVATPA